MLDIKFLGKIKIEYDGVDITDKFGAKTKNQAKIIINKALQAARAREAARKGRKAACNGLVPQGFPAQV